MSVPARNVPGYVDGASNFATSMSGVAIVMSVIALVWQVISWRRSGPGVSVAARAGAAGTGESVVVIEAKNSGRLATEIQGCGFDLPSGRQIVRLVDFFGQPLQLPAQLAAGGEVNFHLHAPDVAIPLAAERVTSEGVRAFVRTGHGRINGKPFHLGEVLAALAPYGGPARRSVD